MEPLRARQGLDADGVEGDGSPSDRLLEPANPFGCSISTHEEMRARAYTRVALPLLTQARESDCPASSGNEQLPELSLDSYTRRRETPLSSSRAWRATESSAHYAVCECSRIAPLLTPRAAHQAAVPASELRRCLSMRAETAQTPQSDNDR